VLNVLLITIISTLYLFLYLGKNKDEKEGTKTLLLISNLRLLLSSDSSAFLSRRQSEMQQRTVC